MEAAELRLYTSSLKLVFYLVISLAFVGGALFLLQHPGFHAHAGNVVMAYVAICLFGLGAMFWLIMLLPLSISRRPVLQVDAQGWTYRASFWSRPQHVNWQDISGVAIRLQQMPTTRMYYLALIARYPDKLPPSRLRRLSASMYPSMSRAAMTIPLNTLFVRTTPAKAVGLLRDIQARFANELHGYDVTVADAMQPM